MPRHTEGPPSADSRWNAVVARYRQPITRKGVWQVVNTAGPLALLWLAMYFGLRLSYAVTLALAVPTAFFLVRLFIIQHDCGHGAFFKSQRLNDALGSVIGVLTLTPYAYWRKTHALHHAGSGNLEHRGFGDIATLTIVEYRALSWWGRVKYRFYRHPATLFLIGPVWQFVFWHRLPVIVPSTWRRERLSIVRNDLALAALVTAMILVFGWKAFLLVQVPVSLLAGSVGVWLFYVQHQFEDTYWEHDERWSFVDAGLRGSPNYRLQEVFDENPDLQRVTTLTFWESVHCVRLALWDEAERRLVSFREARRRA